MAARLVFISGPKAGSSFHLTGTQTTVGRKPASDLRFAPNEVIVSGHHATIWEKGGRFFLRDEGSRNGTFVDGQRVQETELFPGQEVMFGPNGPTALFEMDPDAAPAGAPAGGPVGTPETHYVPQGAGGTGPPSGGPSSGSGLTNLLSRAREQAAGASGVDKPSGTAIMKAFVGLASERSSRRTRLLVGAVAGAGALAVLLVLIVGQKRSESLQENIVLVQGELETVRAQRDSWERQLGDIRAQTAAWESESEELKAEAARMRLAVSASEARLQQQFRLVEQQRAAIERDQRFGPLVTERYARSVSLLHFVMVYVASNGDVLRFRGTRDGKWVHTTDSTRSVAVVSNTFCTGFLIHQDGWVLSNRHCVLPPTDTIRVGTMAFGGTVVRTSAMFPPGTQVYDATPHSYSADAPADVGLFKLSSRVPDIPAVPLSRTATPGPGEPVVVLGYPTGYDNIAWRSGPHADELAKAQDGAFRRTVADAGLSAWVKRWSDYRAGRIRLSEDEVSSGQLLLSRIRGHQMLAAISKAADLGIIQPHFSRGTVTDTTTTNVFHDAETFGGTSGSPVFMGGSALRVIAVHNSGMSMFSARRGKGFTKNSGVPVSYVWQFLPEEVRRGMRRP